MVKVLKLNSISPKVNDVLDKNYEITSECDNPDLILVRSAQMADFVLPESVVAIGRAGAGVNNIPHAEYAKRGVVVFNSPGANANAVKELVITALLLSCRKIIEGIKWVNSQNNAEGGVAKIVEKGKAQFVGGEISGKPLPSPSSPSSFPFSFSFSFSFPFPFSFPFSFSFSFSFILFQ